jgi:hypothetical protein
MRKNLIAIALFLSACSYDWETLDPRLAQDGPATGGGAGVAGSGDSAGSGGHVETGGVAGMGATAGQGGTDTGNAGGQSAGAAGVGGQVGGGTAGTAGSAGADGVAGIAGQAGGGAAGTAGAAGAGGAMATRVCGTADEGARATLTCPSNLVIRSVDFASYGTPTGACAGFATSACDAATSLGVVQTACLGGSTCTVTADNATFGDPCSGTRKHLYIEATCSN